MVTEFLLAPLTNAQEICFHESLAGRGLTLNATGGAPLVILEVKAVETWPMLVIAFTARSGSTALSSLLETIPVFGTVHEFLNPRGPMEMFVNRLGGSENYWERVQEEYSGPGGLFAFKVSWLDFKPEFIPNDARYVFLTRNDKVAQALSLYRARETGIWHEKTDYPPLDLEKVLSGFHLLQQERTAWERFFESKDIIPLRITYEEFCECPLLVVAKIMKHAGLIGECSYKKLAPHDDPDYKSLVEELRLSLASI